MKMQIFFPFLLLVILSPVLYCCENKNTAYKEKSGNKILKPDNKIKSPSYGELFSKIEIIPLESDPDFLIANIDKAVAKGDTLILFDMFRSKVGMFSSKGEFIQLIGNKGQGPGEYIMIYDFSLIPSKDIISLLSPFGELYNYKLTGEFVEKINLPVKHNYFACSWLNDKAIILWSTVEEDEPGLTLYDTQKDEIIYEDWFNDRMIDMSRLKPFFKYDDSVFFAAPLSFSVYKITSKELALSYTWDFERNFIPDSYIENLKSINSQSEKNQKIIEDLKKGNIENPCFNGENQRYCYIAIAKGLGDTEEILNVLYNKITGNSFLFRILKEGISLKPIYMNDEYILGIVSPEEYELYSDITGYKFLRDEEDNPVLAKFYLKN